MNTIKKETKTTQQLKTVEKENKSTEPCKICNEYDEYEYCLGCETGCDNDSAHKIKNSNNEYVYHPECFTRAAEKEKNYLLWLEVNKYDDPFEEDSSAIEAEKRNNALLKRYGNLPSYAFWRPMDIDRETENDKILWWNDLNIK